MRLLIQRVKTASVRSADYGSASIGGGLLIFIGIEDADETGDLEWLCGKVARLRVFDDADGVMNLSVMETTGQLMVISQFTLHASTKKGNRPSYIKAASPDKAIPLYEAFVKRLKDETGLQVETGWFGAHMEVELINDGPVTIIIDSRNRE